jgi:hypothetical protein
MLVGFQSISQDKIPGHPSAKNFMGVGLCESTEGNMIHLTPLITHTSSRLFITSYNNINTIQSSLYILKLGSGRSKLFAAREAL